MPSPLALDDFPQQASRTDGESDGWQAVALDPPPSAVQVNSLASHRCTPGWHRWRSTWPMSNDAERSAWRVQFTVPAVVEDVPVRLLFQEVHRVSAFPVKGVGLDRHAIQSCQSFDGCPQHVLLPREKVGQGEDSLFLYSPIIRGLPVAAAAENHPSAAGLKSDQQRNYPQPQDIKT